MKIAVLSDIHGNLEALEAVLADLGERADRVVCLGDLIGYGPDPDAVVSRVRALGCTAIMGNHEAALAGGWERARMNFQARANNIATESLLSEENLHYCLGLPRTVAMEEALFVHGCPPDSVNRYLYLLAGDEVARIMKENPHRLSFVGHTHEMAVVRQAGDGVVREHPAEGRWRFDRNRKYIVNCGSVGQPRDADRRAKYLIWDSEAWTIEVVAVVYDAEKTAEKILRLGFPRSFADRLL